MNGYLLRAWYSWGVRPSQLQEILGGVGDFFIDSNNCIAKPRRNQLLSAGSQAFVELLTIYQMMLGLKIADE